MTESGTLVAAARRGDVEAVTAAVAAGADVNETDDFGQTALMCMAQQAELGACRALLAAGADPFAISSAPGRKGMTAMDYAFMEQDAAAGDLRGKARNYAKIIRLLEPPEEDVVEDGANEGNRAPPQDSQAELLLGADGWATHKEFGVLFSLDATRCMFSSGNVTERGRMGGLDAAGETVVDLFTGIGYYTLPLLARAGAAKVFACEWNPHAVEALRVNLDTNSVAARCEVRQGDCRQVAPTGVADRVLLGLLPSSTCGWPTAVAALKSSGGWLHVHENVKDSEEEEWVAATAAKMEELAAAAGRRWTVSVAHLEHVKWYAPHIRHVVLDLHCCADSGAHLEGAISQPVRPELA